MSECNWPTCGCRHNLTNGTCCKATVHSSITWTVAAAIAALVMRERAAKACDGFCSECARAIRALPTTFTDAELLAAAMRLPEVLALADIAFEAKTQLENGAYEGVNFYTGETRKYYGVRLETWSALRDALAPFKGDNK